MGEKDPWGLTQVQNDFCLVVSEALILVGLMGQRVEGRAALVCVKGLSLEIRRHPLGRQAPRQLTPRQGSSCYMACPVL